MILVLFLFLLLLSPQPAVAADVTVICRGNDCIQQDDLPLVTALNIAPGYTSSHQLHIDNRRPRNCYLKLSGQPDSLISPLASKITLTVDSTSLTTLADLLDTNRPPLDLGTISPRSIRTYDFIFTFDFSAGNEYQDLYQNFNLNLNFTCDEEIDDKNDDKQDDALTPTPTSAVIFTSSASSGPRVLGAMTTITPVPTSTPSAINAAATGQVQGDSTSTCLRFWLPILFVLALIGNLLLLAAVRRRNFALFLALFLSATTYFIDRYLLTSRCCLIFPGFCQYFWIGNLASFLIPAYLFFFRPRLR